jgi:hypothetical protein
MLMALCGTLDAQRRAPAQPAIRGHGLRATGRDCIGNAGTAGPGGCGPTHLAAGHGITVRDGVQILGTFTMTDTGSKIQGRHIDIFIADPEKAKQFGKKMVKVRVLRCGQRSPA